MSRITIAIADGIGGCNGGEIASEEVMTNLHFFIKDIPSGLTSDVFCKTMEDWTQSINKVLISKGSVVHELANMGTTLVGMIFYEGHVFHINSGDSRLYRLRGDVMSQLTTDHSLDMITGNSDDSNILTNSIGGGCMTSYIDITEDSSNIHPKDVYMLCSDGLTDMLSNEDIKSIIKASGDTETLCNAAIAAGGYDNVSVCLIHVS